MDVDMDNYSHYISSQNISTSTSQLNSNMSSSCPVTAASPVRTTPFTFSPLSNSTPAKPSAGKISIPSLQERLSLMQEVFGDPDEEAYENTKGELESEYDDSGYFGARASEQETNEFLDSLGFPPAQASPNTRRIAGSRRVWSAQAGSRDPRIRAKAIQAIASSSTPPSPSRDLQSQAGQASHWHIYSTESRSSGFRGTPPLQMNQSEDVEMADT
ncbi:hypothetical protein VKT23_000347 [Stygiomarasmius scandens]|uniref:Uncharacterized protein n=1 Tax=Marasmiellus scandens TaxID=2682957 RepID=A0ABR1K3T7_9AGAR